MWKCANDIFQDCTQEPDWAQSPKEIKLAGTPADENSYLSGGHCKLDPSTCGKTKAKLQPIEIPHHVKEVVEKAKPTSFLM